MSDQPILFHCSCGAALHPYVICGPIYHEYIVALDTEANFVRYYAPPTTADTAGLTIDEYNDWMDLYHGDLVYAQSYARVEAWIAGGGGHVHDIRNADGSPRWTASPHKEEVSDVSDPLPAL